MNQYVFMLKDELKEYFYAIKEISTCFISLYTDEFKFLLYTYT